MSKARQTETTTQPDITINAATKGNKIGDNGKGNGYGQGWEFGEWGHPRRACEVFRNRIGEGQTEDGSIFALKGAGQNGKGGKWGNGNGTGGKGKSYYNGK